MFEVRVENPYATMVRDAFYSSFDSNTNCDDATMSTDHESSVRATTFFFIVE